MVADGVQLSQKEQKRLTSEQRRIYKENLAAFKRNKNKIQVDLSNARGMSAAKKRSGKATLVIKEN